MELVNYLRIVRRRWRMVALCLVLGVLGGVASSTLSKSSSGPGVTFYLAKHTLSSSDGTANLTRDAALCTEGEVPKRVATKLGYDNPTALAAKVTCEPHPETNLLYVAAADVDPKRSVAIADTFAEQLVGYLRDVSEQLKQTRIDTFNKQISGLQDEYAGIQQDLGNATDKTQQSLLQQRSTDIAKKINDLKDQKNTAQAQPAVTETLTTLSTAESVPISPAAYESLVNADPSKATAKNSPTQSATRQSQIDAAIKTGGGLNLVSRVGLGAALGLILGLVLTIVLDRVDPRIRTKAEAEEAFGWPVIGEIPPLTRRERNDLVLFAVDEPRSRAAESYRVLRSALLFSHTDPSEAAADDVHPIFANTNGSADLDASPPDGDGEGPGHRDGGTVSASDPASATGAARAPGHVIMVTSPGPSEGKTTTAANIAAILAETGRSVLVVNCDFRRARIHMHLGATNESRQVVDTRVPGVKLVTQVLDNPHEANPAQVLQAQRQVIRNARTMFDIVLLDTAPLLTTNDATEVLSVADQVLIVVKTGKTHKEAADRAAELLERRNGPVLGVILVGATDVPTSRYYYYGDNPLAEDDATPGHETISPFEELVHPGGVPAFVSTSGDPGTDPATGTGADPNRDR